MYKSSVFYKEFESEGTEVGTTTLHIAIKISKDTFV